jgi:diguanylate cyclase (GGDEF)-like protein/PAS domain S-box-containing protein
MSTDAISRAIYEPLETLEALGAAIDGFGGGLTLLRAVRGPSGGVEDWLIVHVNELVASTWRPSFGELAGRLWTTVFGPLERSAFLPLCLDALATGRRQEADVEIALVTHREWRNVAALPAGKDLVAVTTRDIAAQRSAQEQLTLQRARMSALAEHISDIVTITDHEGRITWCSPALRRVLGFDPAQWWARRLVEIVDPGDAELAARLLPEALDRTDDARVEGPERPQSHEVRIATATGEVRWFEATAHDERNNAALHGVVIALHDITERRDALARLRAAETRSRLIVDSVADAIVTVDGTGLIQAFNAAAERTFAMSASEAIGTSWRRLVPDQTVADMVERNRSGMIGFDHVEMLARRSSGELFPAYIAMSYVDTDGERLWIGLCRDISAQKELEATLQRMALHDPLTGIPNRHLLLDAIEEALQGHRADDDLVAVYYIDLDGFKTINDTLGHGVGDRTLIETTIRIQCAARAGDFVARLGGDEFVVVCADVANRADIDALANRLALELNRPVAIDEAQVALSASVGVAVWDGHQSADELLRAADQAMYAAKAQRRKRPEGGALRPER